MQLEREREREIGAAAVEGNPNRLARIDKCERRRRRKYQWLASRLASDWARIVATQPIKRAETCSLAVAGGSRCVRDGQPGQARPGRACVCVGYLVTLFSHTHTHTHILHFRAKGEFNWRGLTNKHFFHSLCVCVYSCSTKQLVFFLFGLSVFLVNGTTCLHRMTIKMKWWVGFVTGFGLIRLYLIIDAGKKGVGLL